jgi:hypothetical protein
MFWSSLAPKWPIPVPFCGMDNQKSRFSLISDTLSVENKSVWLCGSHLGLLSGSSGFESHRSKKILWSLSWFGYSSTPVESLPNLTPRSCWVRHVHSICGPQYGLAVCHHSQQSGRRPLQQNPTWEWRQHSWAKFPMMVIHHTHHLFTSFQHSSLDGAQAGSHQLLGTPSTNFYTQHSILWSPDPLPV